MGTHWYCYDRWMAQINKNLTKQMTLFTLYLEASDWTPEGKSNNVSKANHKQWPCLFFGSMRSSWLIQSLSSVVFKTKWKMSLLGKHFGLLLLLNLYFCFVWDLICFVPLCFLIFSRSLCKCTAQALLKFLLLFQAFKFLYNLKSFKLLQIYLHQKRNQGSCPCGKYYQIAWCWYKINKS